jgi:hypothetical protein
LAVQVLLLSVLARPAPASAAGVTIITHGLNGNVDDWVISMANQMTGYYRFPGTSSTCYELYFTPSGNSYTLTWARIGGAAPTTTDSGEILVKLDWRQLANDSYSTYDVAPAVVAGLLQTTFVSEMNGHALAELPIHLIGHSRGGSLVCEISRLLGTSGVWVDHLTTLDPHPLNNDGFDDFPYTVVDAPARSYENVLFHDNYFQTLNLLFYGEPVLGAYVRELTYLEGGYEGIAASHSDVHLWYHGTIDSRIPANDTVASITSSERQTWWAPDETYGNWGGFFAGFYYSLIGGGDRLSTDQPAGPGTDLVRDGYNQLWGAFGAGTSPNRYQLPSNNGSWPNLIRLDLLGTNSVAQGDAVLFKYFIQNLQSATVTFFLDNDWNPLNGVVRQIGQLSESAVTRTQIKFPQFTFDTLSTTPGTYAVFARITAGGHTRYLYATEPLTIRPPPCTYSTSPAERSHAAAGGSGSVSITTRSDCEWTATSGCGWVQVTGIASGEGNGSVAYVVQPNPGCAPRTCTLTIAGRTFIVRQQGGAGTFSLASPGASHGPGAESGTVSVIASGSDCTWSATVNCGWVRMTSGAGGVGSGTADYSVDANPDCIPRSCTLTVAGNTFTVNQAAGSGTFMISPSSRNYSSGTANGNVSVTSGIGCDWTAMSNDGWISVTAGATGTGNGTVSYSLEANADSMTRTGTVSVAGSTFIVTQAGDTTRPFVNITPDFA